MQTFSKSISDEILGQRSPPETTAAPARLTALSARPREGRTRLRGDATSWGPTFSRVALVGGGAVAGPALLPAAWLPPGCCLAAGTWRVLILGFATRPWILFGGLNRWKEIRFSDPYCAEKVIGPVYSLLRALKRR